MPASSFLALPPCGSSSVLLAEESWWAGGTDSQGWPPSLHPLSRLSPPPQKWKESKRREHWGGLQFSRAGGAGSPLLAVRWGSPGGSETTQNSGFCSRPSSGSQLGCWLRNTCSEAVSCHGVPRTRQSTKERWGAFGRSEW